MNSKTNEILNDIIHIASQAILAEDEAIKRQAMGDIVYALASVIPAKRSARGADPTDAPLYVTPQPVVDFCQSEMQRMEARKNRRIFWNDFNTKEDICVMGKTKQNNKVYEVRIFKRKDAKNPNDFFCNVNGETVLDGTFTGSAWMLRRMLKAAMQSLVEEKARRSRNARRADKRHAGILSAERELAATVARQMDDDELAKLLENA